MMAAKGVVFLICSIVLGLIMFYLASYGYNGATSAGIVMIVLGIMVFCFCIHTDSFKEHDEKAEKRAVREYQVQSLHYDDNSKRNDSDFILGYGYKQSHGKTIKYYVMWVKRKNGGYKIKKYRASKVTLSFDAKDNDSASIKMKYDGFNKPIGDSYIKLPQNTIQEKVDLAEY